MSDNWEVASSPLIESGVAQVPDVLLAEYEDLETILNRRLMAGAIEAGYELRSSGTCQPTEGLPGKLGELLYCATQVAEQKGIHLSEDPGEVAGALDSLQRYALVVRRAMTTHGFPATLPIFKKEGGMVNEKVKPWQLLNLLALRVVDVGTKTEERLWYWEEGEAVTAPYAIQDLIMYTALTADQYGFRLSDIYTEAKGRLSGQVSRPDITNGEASSAKRDRASELGQALKCLDLIGRTLDPDLVA